MLISLGLLGRLVEARIVVRLNGFTVIGLRTLWGLRIEYFAEGFRFKSFVFHAPILLFLALLLQKYIFWILIILVPIAFFLKLLTLIDLLIYLSCLIELLWLIILRILLHLSLIRIFINLSIQYFYVMFDLLIYI